MSFSENLAIRMQRQYETGYSLAKKLGISQSTVSNWLNGKSLPQLRHIVMLANHYNVPTSEIMQEVSDSEKGGVRSFQERNAATEIASSC